MKAFGSKILVLGAALAVLVLGSTVLARPPSAEPPPAVPFSTGCAINSFDSAGRAQCILEPVPVGFRFEIRTVTAGLQIGAGLRPIEFHAQIATGGNVETYFFPATFQGDSAFFTGDFFTVNQSVLLNADGGSTPVFSVTLSDAGSGFADIALSGVLLPE
jgi:hypothetical protein